MRIRAAIGAALVIVCLASATPLEAIDWKLFKDSEDGALDLSDWLLSKGGFLPVPVIVTEPAVGFGLGLAPVFFHGELAGEPDPEDPDRYLPPSMTAAVGLYTTNNSWMVGGGHLGYWKRDTIRYTGFLGVMNLNIDFYAGDNPLEFNIDGGFLMQEVKFRLGKSDFFIGGTWMFFKSDSSIPGLVDLVPPEWGDFDFDALRIQTSGLGVIGYYDGRDNIFTPDTGQEAELEISRFDEAIGSDFNYWSLSAKVLSFHKLHRDFVLGLRFDGDAVDGEVPFFAYPFVSLRGIPAMRYQGEQVLTLEAEARFRVWKRWSLIGFVGKGWTWADIPRLQTDENIYSFGTGFRYLAARKLNMHIGIDVARGPEDTAVYLQMGHAWGQ